MPCKRTTRPRAATIIDGDDDLLMEILVLLPAKSIVRFNSVSKHWCSLVSTPNFFLDDRRRRHLVKTQHSFILRREPHFFYFNPIYKVFVPYSFNSPSKESIASIAILQSCNGLLLLECKRTSSGRKIYYVCNPTTGKYRDLHFNNPGRSKSSKISGFSLAFDPWKSPHYKVVCVTNLRFRKYRFDFYDSESHTWKYLGEHLVTAVPPWFDHGIYWKTGIYWEQPYESLYLDLENGNLESIQARTRTVFNQSFIEESNGHIHSVDVDLQPKLKFLSKHNLLHPDGNAGSFHRYWANPCSTTYSAYWANPVFAASARKTYPLITLLGIIRGEQEEGMCKGTEEDLTVAFHVPGKITRYRFSDCNFEVLLDLTSHDIFQDGQLQFKNGDHAQNGDITQFIEILSPV